MATLTTKIVNAFEARKERANIVAVTNRSKEKWMQSLGIDMRWIQSVCERNR